MKNGLYIYGIVSREAGSRSAGKASVPQEFGEIGIGNKASKVFAINFKDLVVVVSRSPFKVYDSKALEETVKDLVTHQFVIEKVMESFTIIPVKFGTMVGTEDDVAKFLDKGYSLLRNALRKIEGKIELDVVASWNLPKTLEAIYCRSPQIKRKQKEIALKGDKATVEDKVALGKLVDKTLKGRKIKLGKLILQALKKEALDVCLHDLATDEIVLNAAFLIRKENEEFFNKAVNRLNQKLANTLDFRVVGPLPPYSFSTVIFKSISPREVEEAKKALGLNGDITDKTVNHAYRQLAQECHPDKNAGQVFDFEDFDGESFDPELKTEGLSRTVAQTRGGQPGFDLINSAYRVLKDFTKRGFFNVDIYHWEEQR